MSVVSHQMDVFLFEPGSDRFNIWRLRAPRLAKCFDRRDQGRPEGAAPEADDLPAARPLRRQRRDRCLD